MKILIIRFSSIGDIVLTTPVVKALKAQLNDVEIHYLTKKVFASILLNNPAVERVHTIDSSVNEVIHELKQEQFDYIIDLHNNIRTKAVKSKLRAKAYTVDKLNVKKFMLVKFKRNKMPDVHVVDRYFDTVAPLGVSNHGETGDYFIPAGMEVDVQNVYKLQPKQYVAIAIGAQFATKQMPASLLIDVIRQLNEPVILIGGETDEKLAQEVIAGLPDSTIANACGKHNLDGSASIVAQSRKLITNDTGMMHIGACLNVPIVSVWGNTVPALGMYPYYPHNKEMYSIHQVEGLGCRPCSKIGYQQCPKGHFDCMHKQDVSEIVGAITRP